MVRAELELIIEVTTEEFWQDVTAPMLENVRRKLRSLVKFIDKAKRPMIYTDFQDFMGEETEVELPGIGSSHDVERFRDKTEQFLKAHADDPVIHKLRWNEPLNKADLDVLERMLVKAGTGTEEDIRQVKTDGGLGLFVRRIVGLDREAAKRAMDVFLSGKTLNATQIQFMNRVTDYLTQSGWLDPSQLYESPFTDFSPNGVEGVFPPEHVTQLISVLGELRQRAAV
jgi:type I restriction enzyme R subunit